MEEFICSYCGSKDVTYQEYYHTYTCHGCNRILGEDELKGHKEKVEVVEEEEQEVQDELEYEPYQEEDLNGFSLVVLNIVTAIPFIGIVVSVALCNSSVRDEYKRAFCYKAVVQLLLILGIIVAFAHNVKDGRELVKNGVHTLITKTVELSSMSSESKMVAPDLRSRNMQEIIESRIEPAPDISEEEREFVPTWDFIDGSIMSGKKIKEFLEYAGEEWILLIQTKGIRDRYDENAYRNIGYITDASEKSGQSDNYFYYRVLDKPVARYTTDYGEYIHEDYSDLGNKKYIYYIDSKKNFKLTFLYTEEGAIAGFAVTESEEK